MVQSRGEFYWKQEGFSEEQLEELLAAVLENSDWMQQHDGHFNVSLPEAEEVPEDPDDEFLASVSAKLFLVDFYTDQPDTVAVRDALQSAHQLVYQWASQQS